MPQQIKKNLGGCPSIIFSPQRIAKVQELSQSLTIAQIADYFGISQSTFYQIQRRQPELSEAYKIGKVKAIDWVVSKLKQKIEEGDTAATIFYLKTQAGWTEKQKLDIDANVNSLQLGVLKFETTTTE